MKIKSSLILNYIVYAILLNSVGIVIMKVINEYGVAESDASVLEMYKDMTIAIVSFLIASFIPRFGYKNSMLSALLLTGLVCLAMPLTGGGFLMSKVLFAVTGFSFALIKVSVYSTVGLITDSTDDHASFMSILEGLFMVGVLSGFWIFGFFIDAGSVGSVEITWLDTYYVLALISFSAALLMAATQLDESEAFEEGEEPNAIKDFMKMVTLFKLPLVFIFILSAFIYVFIEQSIQTWLPTFNNKILQLPEAISVYMSSIYMGHWQLAG